MFIRQLYDPFLAQYTYLVGVPSSGEAFLIDPQRDVQPYFDAAEAEGLELVAAFETHLHADFVSGLRGCAEHGLTVYASRTGAPDRTYDWLAGSDYDYTLLGDGDTVDIGTAQVEALATPGHSPEHLTYLIRDRADKDNGRLAVATGDFLFVEGLGRPRLVPSASDAEADPQHTFAQSLQAFRELPDAAEVWPLHGAGTRCGYAPSLRPSSTVAHEKAANPVVRAAENGTELGQALQQPYPVSPPYFSRVKAINQSGPPLLGSLPRPQPATVSELIDLSKGRGVAFLDTRRSRSDFMAGHLPGALHTPLDASFLSVVGSYVPPELPIYLLLEETKLSQTVRALARIGLDNVAGYCPLSVLSDVPRAHLERTPVIRFDQFPGLMNRSDVRLLDVRAPQAYEDGHIDEALNAPFLKLGAALPRISPDTTLLVYSQTGRRAAAASAYLERCGYNVGTVDDAYPNGSRQPSSVDS